MINNVVLIGRITRDIEMTMTNGGTEVVRFNLAVNRNRKNANGEYDADFISCVAFGQAANFMSQYLRKGYQIAITGRIQTGNYEKDGQRIYTTDVIVESVNNLEPRQQNNQQNDFQPQAPTNNQQIMQDHFGGQQQTPQQQYQQAQNTVGQITEDDLPF